MTTYILAGGNDRAVADYPVRLKNELPPNLSDLNVLSCFFAAPKEQWPEKAASWRTWFTDNLGIKNYDWADYDTFVDKLKNADIVYIHGGITKQLLEAMKRYPNLESHMQDKIVIGSSAGANMLAKHYWSSTFAEYGNGLGFVDANIMVHYDAKELEEGSIVRSAADWKEYHSTFQHIIGDNEKVTPLPEGNIIIFGKN